MAHRARFDAPVEHGPDGKRSTIDGVKRSGVRLFPAALYQQEQADSGKRCDGGGYGISATHEGVVRKFVMADTTQQNFSV